jgi:hypothetical protein
LRRAVRKPGQTFTSGKEEPRYAALQAGADFFACKVDPREGLLVLMYGLAIKNNLLHRDGGYAKISVGRKDIDN